MVRGSTLGWENITLMGVSWCLSRGGGATNLSGIGVIVRGSTLGWENIILMGVS